MKQQVLDRNTTTTPESYSAWDQYHNNVAIAPRPQRERKEPEPKSVADNSKQQCTNSSRHLLQIFLVHLVLASILVTFLLVSPVINSFSVSLFMLLTYVGGYKNGKNACLADKK